MKFARILARRGLHVQDQAHSHASTEYRRKKLAGQLWPDSTEENAGDYLRQALWRIRKALQAASAGSYLQADDLTLWFDGSSDYWLDAAALQDIDDESARAPTLHYAEYDRSG